jgi:hypothetical protein
VQQFRDEIELSRMKHWMMFMVGALYRARWSSLESIDDMVAGK